MLSLAELPEDSSPPPELASLSAPAEEVVPVVEALLVEVVDVVLVRVASLSAVVLLGGAISGVLRGVASETVPPPQAASVKLVRTSADPTVSWRSLRPATRRDLDGAPIRAPVLGPATGALTRPAGPSAGRT